jgi:hypothetical protein
VECPYFDPKSTVVAPVKHVPGSLTVTFTITLDRECISPACRPRRCAFGFTLRGHGGTGRVA